MKLSEPKTAWFRGRRRTAVYGDTSPKTGVYQDFCLKLLVAHYMSGQCSKLDVRFRRRRIDNGEEVNRHEVLFGS
ncbi:MAG: hypothetical protein OEQ28_16350, partial [Acidobacteriota bacterium]|nr:hypothetical protein [Acidobacteriota bacterium]